MSLKNQNSDFNSTDFSNRRPSYPVVAPAITRHLIFRKSHDDSDRLLIGDKIAEHIQKIRACFGVPTPPITFNNKQNRGYSLRKSNIFTIINSKSGYDFRFRIRFDIYSESYTITYIIDNINIDKLDNFEDINGLQIHKISKFMVDLYQNIDSKSEDVLEKSIIFEAFNNLYDNVWVDQCENKMFDEQNNFINQEILDKRYISDIRGIVIRPNIEIKTDNKYFFINEFFGNYPAVVDVLIKNQNHDFLESGGGFESVFCGMLSGDAIYSAKLGQWGNESTGDGVIRHFLAYGGPSRHQLGRLIRRLHLAGESRNMAMLDYENNSDKDIRASGQSIRKLGKSIDKIIHDGEIGKFDVIYNQVLEFGRISATTDDPLSYRVDRSRYYASQFKNLLPHLRVIKFKGFQSYEEFVSRYLYQDFDRIDRIGFRYDNMGHKINRLIYLNQSKGMEEYRSAIIETTGNIKEVTDDLNQVSYEQRNLLDNAEYIAYIVMSYYVMSTIHSVLKDSITLKYYNNGIIITVFLIIWFTVTLFLTIKAFSRIRSNRNKKPAPPKRLKSNS